MQLEQPTKNAIENYKGVMLCSRPGDNNTAQGPKPFCARVVPPDALGLLPFKKNTVEEKPIRKLPSIVDKHKKWLQGFQLKQIVRKEQEEIEKQREQEKFKNIRETAQQDRQKAKAMKQQYQTMSKNVMNILDEDDGKTKNAALNVQNLRKLNELGREPEKKQVKINMKKTNRPAWAQTQQQVEKKEQDQEDQLLDFFEKTDVEQFINDTEVNAILKSLKDKIDNIKKEDNWRDKQKQVERDKQQQETQDDNVEQRKSVQSKVSEGGKSVASEKSTKRIEELKQKLQKKKEGVDEWDTSSKVSKNSVSKLEERIAKNVADEVLRSYGNFKGVHSNTSVRRLLQREAARQLSEPHPRPIITTVIKEKNELDMNNLPYLHRNPAI